MKQKLLKTLFVVMTVCGLAQAKAADYVFSFTQSRLSVAKEQELTLVFYNNSGVETKLTEPAVVSLSAVEGERTTAVEGKDYTLSEKQVTVAAGQSRLSVMLHVTGKITEANNLLRLQAMVGATANQNFRAGDNRYISLTLSSEVKPKLSFNGNWKMSSLVTDAQSMNQIWGGGVTFNEAFPVFEAKDWLVISDNGIEPHFKSTLKNFFTGSAGLEFHAKYTLRGLAKKELEVFKLTGVNRNFDANSQSADNTAYIGLRIVTDADSGKELLDVYLIDYASTSFAPEFASFGMYEPRNASEPYVAWQEGVYINFLMERTTTSIAPLSLEQPLKRSLYNLRGQQLSRPQHGIMIMDGRKVVVK